MRIPLLGGSYEGISTNTSSQEAINFYFEPPAPGEQHEGAYLPVHGATLFGTIVNASVIRALLFDPGGELLYAVSGDDFYEVDANGDETDRGDISTATGYVEMALAPVAGEIIVVTAAKGYIYDIATTTLTEIADADFPDAASTCAMIDGRFLVNDTTTAGKFWWSAINDGTTWGSTSFSTAESLTSTIKQILVDRRDVFLFGDTKSEIWQHVGDADDVFARLERINAGIVGHTAARFDNTVAWLSRTEYGELQAVKAGGAYQPVVFSTPELSRKWHELSDASDAFAWVYQLDGHEFYVVCFPTGGATYAFDAVTQRWHMRSGAFSSGEPTRDPVNAAAFAGAWGGHITGDSSATGKLWSLSESVYTWDSVNMPKRLTGITIAAQNEDRLRFSEVQADLEEGTIQSGDTGDDRQITLSWSNDNGHNFNTGVQLDIGEAAVDGRDHRAIVRKLGYGRSWVFRVYSDTPRRLIVKGLYGRIYGMEKSA